MHKLTKEQCAKRVAILLIIALLMVCLAIICSTPSSAQNVKRQGNTFIEQVDSAQTKTLKGKVYETDYIYIDRQGHAYTIYLSSNGNAFINKVSEKSGRKYRKYLPQVTKMIQNQSK